MLSSISKLYGLKTIDLAILLGYFFKALFSESCRL